MNKVWTGARVIAFSLALLASTAVLAGYKGGHGVRIDDPDHFADGSLGAVRGTADANQSIGCSNYGDWGVCAATDQNGTTRTCIAQDAAMLATIRSLNGDSYMFFEWDASSGYCTLIYVDNDSSNPPKS
jgi:hypothetical protein